MRNSREKIYKVATLQDFGYPAVSLFADMHSGHLYLFLTSDIDGKYGVIPVSQRDIKHYMDGDISLNALKSSGFYEGYLEDGMAIVTDIQAPSCKRTMSFYGVFDKELFYDDIHVFSFLYDLNHNNKLTVS